MTGNVNSLAYNSVWQLRADAWSNLEETSSLLAALLAQGRPAEHVREEIGRLLDLLDPIEQYWGFPGKERFEQMLRLYAAADHERLARTIAGINRAVVTDSFRDGISWPPEGASGELAESGMGARERPGGRRRPYFEVLVVEEMNAQQERALKEEMRRLRRPEDEFVYEVVVVPSFDDALTAVQFNFSLQACVIRRRFAQHSRHDLSRVGQFVDSGASEDMLERTPDDRAQALGRRLHDLRPELDLYLMTVVAVEEIAGRLSRDFRRVFHAREGLLELHLSFLGGVGQRYRAPFFEALREYSHKPTGVFHALPISRGKSVT
ncbi:MAG TPA: hypothetical protein VFR35_03795, partial [Actinoplanes sp.]|nr:hypothetical protein [Actinoplanes sp.]